MKTEILYSVIPIVVSLMFFVMYRKSLLDRLHQGRQPSNSAESIIDIVLGADAGDPEYMEKLARCYRQGDRVPQSSSYARQLMAKARITRNQH